VTASGVGSGALFGLCNEWLKLPAVVETQARISSQSQSRVESPAAADSTRQLPRKIFKARRCKDRHEPPGCMTDAAITVQHTAWCKDRCTFSGRQSLPAAGEFEFSFENLEGFVLAMMNVRWRTSSGLVNGFYHT
jgi:hypothetical protein